MKRGSCEKCKCPLTLLRLSRSHYERRRLCARCDKPAPALRLVARASTEATRTVLVNEWGERLKAALRTIED